MAWGVPKLGNRVTVASGNVALLEPATIAQGDLMVACIGARGNAAFTLPALWTIIGTQQTSGDTDTTNGIASGVMAFIVRGASAPALTFTRTGGDVALGRIIAYSGGDASPFDVGSANTLAVASVTATTGSLTTAEDGELIVAMCAMGDALSSSAFDATDPGGSSSSTDTTTPPTDGVWKERQDSFTNTGADLGLAIADAVRATAGATGTIQTTVTAAARHVMIAGAFKVAAATVFNQNLSRTLTLSAVLVKQDTKVLAGMLTLSGVLVKLTTRVLVGTLTVAGAAVKQALRPLAGSLGLSGAVASSKTFLQTLAGSLGMAAEVPRNIPVTLSGELEMSGTMLNSQQKNLAGTLTQSGALATTEIVLIEKSVSGSLGLSSDVTSESLGISEPGPGKLTDPGDSTDPMRFM